MGTYWPHDCHRRHHRLKAARIRRLELLILYYKEATMSLAQLKWSMPVEDVNDAARVDVFDNGAVIGTVDPSVLEFATQELTPGDHAFIVVVRSKAGAQFDSDASNQANVTVPAVSVKLTAVSDLTATLA